MAGKHDQCPVCPFLQYQLMTDYNHVSCLQPACIVCLSERHPSLKCDWSHWGFPVLLSLLLLLCILLLMIIITLDIFALMHAIADSLSADIFINRKEKNDNIILYYSCGIVGAVTRWRLISSLTDWWKVRMCGFPGFLRHSGPFIDTKYKSAEGFADCT